MWASTPLSGRQVRLAVYARNDDRLASDYSVDCESIFPRDQNLREEALRGAPEWLTPQSRIHGRCDGRHPRFWDAAVRICGLAHPRMFTSLWDAIAECVLTVCLHDSPCVIDFKCKHGRHRSVTIAMLTGMVLRWLGASVSMTTLNCYCACSVCCMKSNYDCYPTCEFLDHVVDQMSVRLARRLHIRREDNEAFAMTKACVLACDVVEFADYAE